MMWRQAIVVGAMIGADYLYSSVPGDLARDHLAVWLAAVVSRKS